MAPWWLRSSADETSGNGSDGEEFSGEEFGGELEDLPEDVLGLIASEGEDERDEESEAGEEPGPARRKRRRRRRKSKAAAEETAPAEPREEAAAKGEPAHEKPAFKRSGRPEREEETAETVEKKSRKRASEPKAAAKKSPAPQRAEKKPVEKEKKPVEKKAETAPAVPAPKDRDSEASSVEPLSREEVLFDLPERSAAVSDERKIALFCDLENIALGVRDSETERFDIHLVIERLLEKGKIVVKRAYADWERYSEYKRAFHDAAIELIDIPHKRHSGKNSADIKMVVDAMDLCFSKEHLDTFVLLSGDSDFSPLVSKLKENNKYVIGVGVKNSTSHHLIDNCDEFIYYEDVWRDIKRTPRLDHLSEKEAEVFGLLVESILALLRENKAVVWGSMLKQTMQRKRPSFSEGYYGYNAFSELLDDAEQKDIIRLKRDQRSGNYAVIGFGQQKG